jgi:hypothetical protein
VKFAEIERLVTEAHLKRAALERELQQEALALVERLFKALEWPENRRRFDIAAAPRGAAIESDVKAQILPSGAVVYWFSLFAGAVMIRCALEVLRSTEGSLVTFSIRDSQLDSIAENLLLDDGAVATKHFGKISKVIATAGAAARA